MRKTRSDKKPEVIIPNTDTMEDKASLTESLLEKVEDYGKVSLELLKLKAIDRTAEAVSSTVSYLLISFMLLACLLTASIGVAVWLGNVMGEIYYGFFAVAGFYALVGIILYAARKSWLKKSISDSIIVRALNYES
ncbi:MAG: hypothetical protein ACXVPN_16415 [Bacteroidia bacterium]